jgi:hypothetical protein
MGLRPSPYQAVEGALRAERYALGDPRDNSNVFKWWKVVLNLPGGEAYNPTMPWIYRAQVDGTIAADIDIYVDDMRLTAGTKEQVWLASARMAKACAYLGLQVDP